MDKESDIYKQVKREADRKFKEPTSAYKSMWISREYKKRGGKVIQEKRDKRLYDWFRKEKWYDVGEYLDGKKKACGFGEVDLCRPENAPEGSSKDFVTIDKVNRSMFLKARDMKKKGLRINWNELV
jgi:hypothetical protein